MNYETDFAKWYKDSWEEINYKFKLLKKENAKLRAILRLSTKQLDRLLATIEVDEIEE